MPQIRQVTWIHVSISSSYCGAGGKLNNMIGAYKAGSNFQAIVFLQMVQMLAGSGTGARPAWYVFGGQGCTTSPWTLYPTDTFAAPYPSYPAIAQFN
jgi:hypothetical protein